MLLGPVEVVHHDHQRSFSRQHLEKSPDGPESLLARAWFSLSEPEQLSYPLGDEFGLVVSREDLCNRRHGLLAESPPAARVISRTMSASGQ